MSKVKVSITYEVELEYSRTEAFIAAFKSWKNKNHGSEKVFLQHIAKHVLENGYYSEIPDVGCVTNVSRLGVCYFALQILQP